MTEKGAPPVELKLIVKEPAGIPRELPMVSGMTMGRHPDNALKGGVVLDDGKVSKFHAEIILEGDQWMVRDMGSSNHTRVTDGPILEKGQTHPLVPGVRFKVGDTELEAAAADVPSDSEDELDGLVTISAQQTMINAGAGDLSQQAWLQSARPRLVVAHKNHGQIVDLTMGKGECRVGRKKDENDVRLEDETVSRLHAKITLREQRFWLEDLGSAMGTFVKGEKLLKGSPREIQVPCALRFGIVDALFVAEHDADGKKPSVELGNKALDELIRNRDVTVNQLQAARSEARGSKRRPEEILLSQGDLTVESWMQALEVARVRSMASGGGGGVLKILLLLIIVGAALAAGILHYYRKAPWN